MDTSVAPQIFEFSFGDKPVNSGEAMSVTCSVIKGDFPMDISWALNGEPITAEQSDITISNSKRVSLLAIDAVAARHTGEYTCTASNRAGAASHSAVLAVNGIFKENKKRILIFNVATGFQCRIFPNHVISPQPS